MGKLIFNLTDEARKAAFVATGVMPPATNELPVDPPALTPEQRTVLARCMDGGDSSLPGAAPEIDRYDRKRMVWGGCYYWDHTPGVDEWIAVAADLWARADALTPEIERAIVQADAAKVARHERERQEARETLRAAIVTHNPDARTGDLPDDDDMLIEYRTLQPQFVSERKAAEAAAKARKLADDAAAHATKLAWAQEHGSEQLRRGLERGHDCQRLYVRERAAIEAPGFTVDIENAAGWKSRACPSERALDAADEADALGLGESEIVWLTAPAADRKRPDYESDVDAEEFVECEAVVIRDYLGKYDLVRAL